MKPVKEYAVIFTYNFDTESEIFLFGNNYDKAVEYLKESFEKELRIEIEENEWEDVESWHNDDWTCASITHYVGIDHDDCEYHLCSNVKRVEE